MTLPTIHLTSPIICPDTVKEKISCIRAHRERIFAVSLEERNGKLLCHNYGHGGAGWTFLFGCVHSLIAQFEQKIAATPYKREKIAVVGAGCYGLLTACILAYRGYTVSIVAKDTQELPSLKAAGFFFPRPRKCSTESERELFRMYGLESYRAYLDIVNGNHPFITQGPKLLPAFYAPTIDPGFQPYSEQNLVANPKEVTICFNDKKLYRMVRYETIFINPAIIMFELWQTIKNLGVPIITREINAFDELEERIIFNCAGLGAKKLTNDSKIIPVQGHLITLQNQPPMDQLQYMLNVKITMKDLKGNPRDELIYYAPKDEGIVGITFLRGQDSPTANYHEFDRLLERCHMFF